MTHATLANLPLLNETNAEAEAAGQLKSARASLGFVPNMYGYMANLPSVLTQYSSGYAAFRSKGGFTTIEQEVVFLVISRANGCDYCTAAHSMVADKMSGVPKDILGAIRAGDPITQARLAALANFTEAMVITRGRPEQSLLSEFLDAGFTVKNVFAVILAISVKTLSNYTNHLAATEVDEAFQAYAI